MAPVIHGHGVTEAQWQACPWLGAMPECTAPALLGEIRRLVVVSPHPDDEVLGCGGLMQAALAAGVPVRVVSVTDGEACYPDQALWPPERLRDVRRHELAQALRALGLHASDVTPVGLPDGEVRGHEAALVAVLADMLGPGDGVLAPWTGDAHPDHDACGRAAQAAARRRGARFLQYPVWAWHWLDPQAAAPWPGARRIALDATQQARKQAAIAAFASQTGNIEGLACPPILPGNVLARFRRTYEVVIA